MKLGFVNAQNSCHEDTENLHTIYEVPHHDHIVGVWCAVSGQRVIGPVFFLQHGELRELREQYFGNTSSNAN